MCIERRSTVATLVAPVALLAACNGRTSYLDATGAAGREEGVLGAWLTAIACIVVALVCIAIVAGIARHRGTRAARDEDAAPARRRDVKSGLNWIYIGVAITFVVLIGTFIGTMKTLNAASRPPLAPSLTLDVTGHQWWWEVRYSDATHPELGFVTANEIHLPVGQPVRVRLQTADVIHSFWIPQLAGKTDVIPGQTNEMWLEARVPQESRGMCGEYCGLQHAHMAFDVVAESPERFDAWARERRGEAAAPTASDAIAGATVFRRSCGGCHAVGGSDALGRIGPDLTHVASRREIGAGALANTPENLARWITNAPAVKEGSRMPAMPLDAAELRSVVAYLETLR